MTKNYIPGAAGDMPTTWDIASALDEVLITEDQMLRFAYRGDWARVAKERTYRDICIVQALVRLLRWARR